MDFWYYGFMVEREQPMREKLVDAVHEDFKGVRDVRVAFPDNWDLVARVGMPDPERLLVRTIYIASDQPERQPRGWEPGGLPREWNKDFEWYRLFKFYEPWPQWMMNVGLHKTPQPDGEI